MAVATRLEDGERTVFARGNTGQAVRASSLIAAKGGVGWVQPHLPSEQSNRRFSSSQGADVVSPGLWLGIWQHKAADQCGQFLRLAA